MFFSYCKTWNEDSYHLVTLDKGIMKDILWVLIFLWGLKGNRALK